jgi:hypothetical protein
MITNDTRPPWPATQRRPRTAVERIDTFLKRDRVEHEPELINLARRIVFGEAAVANIPPQYEPHSS